MMKIPPLSVGRLHKAVVGELESRILSGELPLGSKLPSEKELSEMLGVGRRAVREALHVLQNKGLVEVQMGVGTFVRRNDLGNYLDSLLVNVQSFLDRNKGQLENVIEIREVLEKYALRGIVERRDRGVVEKLSENLRLQRTTLTKDGAEEYHRLHGEFHRVVIESLGNPIISMVYEQVMKLIRDKLITAGNSRAQRVRSVEEHGEILAALESGDTVLCERAFDKHLSLAYRNWKES